MSLTLKTNDEGAVQLDSEGNVLYVNEQGEDVSFNANQAFGKIKSLGAEAKGHRENKQSLQSQIDAFSGITPDEALTMREAIQKNGKNGENSSKEFKDLEQRLIIEHTEKVQAMQVLIEQKDMQIASDRINAQFSNSPFLRDKTTLPAQMAQAIYGGNFKVEDGKLNAFDSFGNMITSSQPDTIGEPAPFEEAIKQIVMSDPNREAILKTNSGGSGSAGNNSTNGATGYDWAKIQENPEEFSRAIKELGKDAVIRNAMNAMK